MLRDPAEDEETILDKKIARKRAAHTRKRQKDRDRQRKKNLDALGLGVVVDVPDEDDDKPRQLKLTIDGPTIEAFLDDYSFVTIIRGPWGSGKSVACITKLFQIANKQRPNRQGVRKTRWAVVRNTYAELRDTTIKTWLDWFPEELYGDMLKQRPYTHTIRVPGEPDARGRPTRVEFEVVFVALDDDNDRKKLLSLELTGAWVNEARETIKPIIDDIIGRTGRYPSKRDGGHSWSGLIMDTNAPSETHWLPIMMGEVQPPESMSEEERDALVRPENWTYYVQPGALLPVRDEKGKVIDFEPNPAAENIRNMTDGFGYYMARKGGKTRSWVLVNFCNELGQLVSGKPVWPSFDKGKHVTKTAIPYDPNLPLLVGIDSTGRNPAAVFAQLPRGRWRILAELVGRDLTSEMFAPQLKAKISQLVARAGQTYEQATIQAYRDPHEQKSETDDRTTTQVYLKHGIRLIPAPGGNGIATRVSTVETLFDHDQIEISPGCTMLIAGCSGGYRYRKLQVTGIEAYDEVPDKRNGFADVCDALQYVALGGGAGRVMVSGSTARPSAVKIATRYKPGENRVDLWARRRARANA